jgi:hypothetical protein
MGVAITTIGAAIGVAGVAGLAAPSAIFRAIDNFKSSPGKIYGAAGVRGVVGAILILGASGTAFPMLIRFIGAVFVFQATLVPLLGLDRVRSLLDWFQARPPLVVRFLFLMVVAFGAFLVWAVLQA